MLIKNKKLIKNKNLSYHGNARRPYYILRGAKISKEQAFEIIANESRRLDYFEKYNEDEIKKVESVNQGYGLFGQISAHSYIDLLKKPGFDWIETFIDPMGNVGANAITYQWPEEYDFLNEHFKYAKKYPYLSYVIIYTNFDELDYEWPIQIFRPFNFIRLCRIKEMFNYAIHVHDGGVEVVDKNEAFKLYDKYMSEYGSDEMFCRDDYNNYAKPYLDKMYINRLCDKWNVSNELRKEIQKYNNIDTNKEIKKYYQTYEKVANDRLTEEYEKKIYQLGFEIMKQVEETVKKGEYELSGVKFKENQKLCCELIKDA